MKTTFPLGVVTGVACLWLGLGGARAADEAPGSTDAASRIGVYDSRAIAYASFSSPENMARIKDLVAAARQARKAGDTESLKELSGKLKAEQDECDLRVFSTAPVDDIVAGMTNRLAIIRKDTGVSRFVSKWDKSGLAQTPGATQVDVTDRLLAGFVLTDKQKKTIESLCKHEPLPLDKARELVKEGKL